MRYSLHIDILSSTPLEVALEAAEEERLEIAKRLTLLSLDSLEAHLRVRKKDDLSIQGKIAAHVTQQCVRTLVPVPQNLEINVDEVISLSPQKQEKDQELGTEDLSEFLEGDVLDVGEFVIQLLSLNLDPYPTTPESEPLEYKEDNSRASPFDVLKKKQ